MSNPAFIVDGQTEKKIIQALCPNQPVKILGCNGKDVSYAAAAKKAASLIRLLNKNYPIIILFDREERTDSSTQIAGKLFEAIISQGVQPVDLLIGVPDRMLENWMLSDIDAVNRHYKSSFLTLSPDGINGKNHMKFLTDGHEGYYETTDGPQIFCKCNPKTMAQISPSFFDFLNKIGSLDCSWLIQNHCESENHARI